MNYDTKIDASEININDTEDLDYKNFHVDTIHSFITRVLEDNLIVLFMKGSKEVPMCGFSDKVVKILQALNVDFKVFNVLESDILRDAIKTYSDWPTVPQLYINKTFIGGCDIVTEMYLNGDLIHVLKKNGIKV